MEQPQDISWKLPEFTAIWYNLMDKFVKVADTEGGCHFLTKKKAK